MTTERKLPAAYTRAVSMAYDVFAGNPDRPTLSRPHVKYDGNGMGLQAQRKGYASPSHFAVTRPDHGQLAIDHQAQRPGVRPRW